MSLIKPHQSQDLQTRGLVARPPTSCIMSRTVPYGPVNVCVCVATVVHRGLRGLFLWPGGRGQVSLLCTARNMSPRRASLPDRKTSRTALLFLRSFLSTAFLALFLSRGSQRA